MLLVSVFVFSPIFLSVEASKTWKGKGEDSPTCKDSRTGTEQASFSFETCSRNSIPPVPLSGTKGYDWTTEAPQDGHEWKKYRIIPHAYPSRTLHYVSFINNGSGSKGAFSFPGATWDRFRCTVEPSPDQTRCRHFFKAQILQRGFSIKAWQFCFENCNFSVSCGSVSKLEACKLSIGWE